MEIPGEDFQRLWRTHSDAVNRELLARWWPDELRDRALKTDLFDEAVRDGLAPWLCRLTKCTVCIDRSFGMHSRARARHPGLQTVSADVRFLPFRDAAFDGILSNSTLDHFESAGDIAVALRELHRVLRPGGQLILTLDNPANPVIWLRNSIPSRLLEKAGIIPYSIGKTVGARRLNQLVRTAGFNPHETDTIVHCPRIFAIRLASWLERHASERLQRNFLSCLMRFEKMAKLPTRFLTGYFVAVRCVKS
jgi:SAM-dependent methyltransferase